MFSERLKLLRAAHHVSQSALGKDLFVSQQAVAKWELGTASPNPEMIAKIAKYFDVSTDYLLGRTDEKSPAPQEPSASLAYSPLEQEIIKAYRAAPPVLQEAVLNVLHIPIPASNVRQKKNA